MKNCTLIPAVILCSFGWISLSVPESHMAEVQPGEDATLLCSNFSSSPTQIIWFRLVNGTHPRCISSIYSSDQPASFCSGVETDRLEVTSNSSTVFLKIKRVDLSDSGFYFCGYSIKTHPVIVSSTYLTVPEESDQKANLASFVLAGLAVLLILVIIALIVQNRKLKTADKEEQNPEQSESLDSDDVNYTEVAFQPRVNRREPEPEVIYAATR